MSTDFFVHPLTVAKILEKDKNRKHTMEVALFLKTMNINGISGCLAFYDRKKLTDGQILVFLSHKGKCNQIQTIHIDNVERNGKRRVTLLKASRKCSCTHNQELEWLTWIELEMSQNVHVPNVWKEGTPVGGAIGLHTLTLIDGIDRSRQPPLVQRL